MRLDMVDIVCRRIPNVYAYSAIDNNVNNLLLLLDEADLSFHPRWQKNFICWMTEFINSNFTGVKVQMSDIKKENWHMRPLAKLTYDIDQSDSE